MTKMICKKLALDAAKSVGKNFQKIRKIDEKFFSSFLAKFFAMLIINKNIRNARITWSNPKIVA